MIENNQERLKKTLISLLSACLFFQLLICYPLWVNSERFYPKIPAFNKLPLLFIDSIDWNFVQLDIGLPAFIYSWQAE